jgi:hypothetical protein
MGITYIGEATTAEAITATIKDGVKCMVKMMER